MKDIKYKKITNEVNKDNISKINEIHENRKNITLKIQVKNKRIYEFNKTKMVFLDIFDETGTMLSFLVGNDEDFYEIIKTIEENKTYFIRGSFLILDEDIKEELKTFDLEFINELDVDKIFGIRALQGEEQ